MPNIQKKCLNCNEPFVTKTSEIKRGNGKFCCLSCSSQYKANIISPKKPNVKCAQCGLKFYKCLSKQKRSKSGLFFCKRSCKDEAQRIGGIEEIQPPHYNDGKRNYREIAFRNYPAECFKCGYNTYKEVLHIHHIDLNRHNNDISNLQVLCPTCHSEYHFITNTGGYAGM